MRKGSATETLRTTRTSSSATVSVASTQASLGSGVHLRPSSRLRAQSSSSISTSVSAAWAVRKKLATIDNAEVEAESGESSPDSEEANFAPPDSISGISELEPVQNKVVKNDLILSSTTPGEVDGWTVPASLNGDIEGKKRVGFDEDASMELQLSPCRTVASQASTLQLTPLHKVSAKQPSVPGSRSGFSPFYPMITPGTPSSMQKAQEIMRSLLSSAMYDIQQESRAELRGLHLDLLRMGRDWKKEMHGAMEDMWADEVRALREENKKLREENERLRRGL